MDFGLLGTAGIARRAFLPAIESSDHDVTAVASRDPDRAAAFADEFGIQRSCGSYEALFDADVDAIYNPLPNSLHVEWTKRAADRGFDVLCEKPLAPTAGAVRDLGDYCDDRGVTLMEAFMYRYHPRTERATELARAFGDVRTVEATFHWPLESSDDIRLSPDLAGGSLLDLGCYAVTAARGFLGEPERVYGRATDARGAGVDTAFVGVLEYEDGATARISSCFDTVGHERYRVEATDGWLEADHPAFLPGETEAPLRYERDGQRTEQRFEPVDQYRLEVDHFAECVRAGRRPRTDADYAEATMRIIDALRESEERGEAVAL